MFTNINAGDVARRRRRVFRSRNNRRYNNDSKEHGRIISREPTPYEPTIHRLRRLAFSDFRANAQYRRFSSPVNYPRNFIRRSVRFANRIAKFGNVRFVRYRESFQIRIGVGKGTVPIVETEIRGKRTLFARITSVNVPRGPSKALHAVNGKRVSRSHGSSLILADYSRSTKVEHDPESVFVRAVR